MFLIFLLKGYPRRTSKYPKRITIFDLIHMMSVVDTMAIEVETPRVDIGYSLKKYFTELIYTNPQMVLLDY